MTLLLPGDTVIIVDDSDDENYVEGGYRFQTVSATYMAVWDMSMESLPLMGYYDDLEPGDQPQQVVRNMVSIPETIPATIDVGIPGTIPANIRKNFGIV